MNKKSTTVQSNEPAAWAKPYIESSLADTRSTFQTNQPALQGFSDDMRSTYGRLAPGAEQGILNSQNAVNAWSSGSMAGRNPGSAVYGRMMAANDPSIGLLSNMTGERTVGDYSGFGQSNPAYGLLDNLASRGPNAASGRVSALGDGGFVGGGAGADYWRSVLDGNTNEAFDSVLNNTLDDVSNRVNARFGASGVGFGSSTDHSGLLSRELGRTSAEMRAANFENDQTRRMAAAGALDGATRGDRAQQLQALGLLGDLDANDRNFGLSAATSLGSLFNQGEGLRLNATQAGDAARSNEFAQRIQATGLLGDAWARQNATQMQGAAAADSAYGTDMDRQMQAWAMAQDLMRGSQGLLSNAAALPWEGVRAQAGGVSGLSNGYGTSTSTQKTSGGLLGDLAQATSIFTGLRGY